MSPGVSLQNFTESMLLLLLYMLSICVKFGKNRFSSFGIVLTYPLFMRDRDLNKDVANSNLLMKLYKNTKFY